MQPAPRQSRAVLGVFALAVVAFAVSAPQFVAAPTDLSAWRLTLGDRPYRDFWTMYAPGSFVVLSWLFEWFGREMLVSRLAALLTSAAAVAMTCVLAARIGGRPAAFLPPALVTAAFLYSGYYLTFGSYPPALLMLLLAVWALGRVVDEPAASTGGDGRIAVAGVAGGIAVWFKHDIGGYGLIAMGLALLLAGRWPWRVRVRRAAIFTAAATAVVAALVGWLVAIGVAPQAYDALVRFPLTDFRHVRTEAFPLVPRFSGQLERDLREAAYWTVCHVPTLMILGAVVVLRRVPPGRPLPFAWWWALLAYPLFWTAAHVQLNTHAISLSLLGGLVGAAAVSPFGPDAGPRGGGARRTARRPWLLLGAVSAWVALLLVEPAYWLVRRAANDPQPLDLPHLAGIREPADSRAWMRDLAAAIDTAAPPGVPLLLVGVRNDTMIFADLAPYWLSSRRPASRHHELHPAITDTERGQREILAAVSGGPPPVLVREHRFDDETTDDIKRAFQRAGVPVGATALDAWIAATYEPAGRFGRYELMRPRVVSTGEGRVGPAPGTR